MRAAPCVWRASNAGGPCSRVHAGGVGGASVARPTCGCIHISTEEWSAVLSAAAGCPRCAKQPTPYGLQAVTAGLADRALSLRVVVIALRGAPGHSRTCAWAC